MFSPAGMFLIYVVVQIAVFRYLRRGWRWASIVPVVPVVVVLVIEIIDAQHSNMRGMALFLVSLFSLGYFLIIFVLRALVFGWRALFKKQG